jgi:ADP-ribosylglycohydrolase
MEALLVRCETRAARLVLARARNPCGAAMRAGPTGLLAHIDDILDPTDLPVRITRAAPAETASAPASAPTVQRVRQGLARRDLPASVSARS